MNDFTKSATIGLCTECRGRTADPRVIGLS